MIFSGSNFMRMLVKNNYCISNAKMKVAYKWAISGCIESRTLQIIFEKHSGVNSPDG